MGMPGTPFEVGARYGRLTLIWVYSLDSFRFRRAHCLCDCGREHWVEALRLFRGAAKHCGKCGARRKYTEEQRYILARYRDYLNSAKRRKLIFELPLGQFRELFYSDCYYCGENPAKGVDRQNNSEGYVEGNWVPCCKQCNFSKAGHSQEDFLSWVQRVAVHQGYGL